MAVSYFFCLFLVVFTFLWGLNKLLNFILSRRKPKTLGEARWRVAFLEVSSKVGDLCDNLNFWKIEKTITCGDTYIFRYCYNRDYFLFMDSSDKWNLSVDLEVLTETKAEKKYLLTILSFLADEGLKKALKDSAPTQ
jgi:hypothetical protein